MGMSLEDIFLKLTTREDAETGEDAAASELDVAPVTDTTSGTSGEDTHA
jgi:hypothetical protein